MDVNKLTYTVEQLLQLNNNLKPNRRIRKKLFSLKLWNPRKKMFPRNNLVTNSYCLKLKKFSTEDDDVDRNRDNTMMKLGLLNVRSLSNKSVAMGTLMPSGNLFDPAHGGLIVMVKDVYSLGRLDIPKLTSFECLCVQISMANTPVILMAIYRPGSKGADKLFFDELSHVVEGLIVNNIPLLIAGDFNIHLEDADDLNARRMEDFFATFDKIRFVHGPTHVKNGTLDFVAATSSYEITDVTVGTPGEFSDHALITCLLPMQKKPLVNSSMTSRSFAVYGPRMWNDLPTELKTNEIDEEIFRKRIKAHLWDKAFVRT
ncbi:hypothetical protein HELRODRAFT_165477 [Helobdella robusta]|uniref:Endonuclease/exonuclease/phosphatase domain-containing protein n=1 Tax=Helobdella robusta TaxID=6412 RepID=T1EWV7_HELRO|nr:hypothetical protein HELRODRAFT_165477 [Helobdella robusta]ESN91444.1 hypothetical protein HELRODRAFT_165477 [Helobdella robusta]